MPRIPEVALRFHNRLVVSCQAADPDAFRSPDSMARFAKAALDGGAAGIRANGVEDIRAIRAAVDLPIIGIQKSLHPDGRILITSTFEEARALVAAGAHIIALDSTARGQRYGAFDRLRRIQRELNVPVMADIATLEEAVAAAEAGANLVASTMRGYTTETAGLDQFEPSFIAGLVRRLEVPVLAEGHVDTPAQAAEAIQAGAFAVIVGTAITRPHEITRRFVRALEAATPSAKRYLLGIDLGGTRTKFGIVSSDGELIQSGSEPTPAGGGREALLEHLKQVAHSLAEQARQLGVAPSALGVATAGWVDPHIGRVAYATENLPGWTGTEIGKVLAESAGLPVAVENDANALAVAEKHFGLARELNDFVCVTLGTGVGGGCYIHGQLNHGAHFFANGLGHIPIVHEGLQCNCEGTGCLEVYANAAALLRYAGQGFESAEAVISAANAGSARAQEALETYASYLSTGLVSMAHLLDPEMVILSGGLAQNNPMLVASLAQQLARKLNVPHLRKLEVRVSELGYHGGVLGAAAVAMTRI